jgi:uncharacterized protein YecE (DUF72 family)
VEPRERYRLGTQGLAYADWVGPFYPEGLSQERWLRFYATRFNALELNTTFYAVPPPERVEKWCRSVPESFRFAIKVGKHITHDAPLRHALDPLKEFVLAMRPFGERLGPLLLQFSPWCGIEQLADFGNLLENLPAGARYAVEFRSPGWQRDDVYRLLEKHRVALVGADHLEHPEQARLQATADFLYVRLVGNHGRYQDNSREVFDPTDALRTWLERIEAADPTRSREVWVMCGNDFAGHAPASLRRFARLAGIEVAAEVRQQSLFEAE